MVPRFNIPPISALVPRFGFHFGFWLGGADLDVSVSSHEWGIFLDRVDGRHWILTVGPLVIEARQHQTISAEVRRQLAQATESIRRENGKVIGSIAYGLGAAVCGLCGASIDIEEHPEARICPGGCPESTSPH